MNFLAHFYLAGESEELIIGNFLGDMIRKVEWPNFSSKIVEGIKMHQQIDYFTDSHKIVKQHKKLLIAKHGHFSGVILDIFYDYFLAKNWDNHHNTSLPSYANWVYQSLEKKESNYNKKAKTAFNHMKKYNWLMAYSSTDGIDQVLKGMAQRTRFDSEMGNALTDLQRHNSIYQDGFNEFFLELKNEFE